MFETNCWKSREELLTPEIVKKNYRVEVCENIWWLTNV